MTGAGAWRQPTAYSMAMSTPVADIPRVRWATVAYQRNLINRELLDADPATLDGRFGPKTRAAVSAFQGQVGLTRDGVIGPSTSRLLWREYVDLFEAMYAIPFNLLRGELRLESAFDPGAEGYVSPRDCGIAQINLDAHPDITAEQAYREVPWAIQWSAQRLRYWHDHLGDIAADAGYRGDLWPPSVAAHNNPSKAVAWASGVEPDTQIATYVWLVYLSAAKPW